MGGTCEIPPRAESFGVIVGSCGSHAVQGSRAIVRKNEKDHGPTPVEEQDIEIVERKGLGHPDSLLPGVDHHPWLRRPERCRELIVGALNEVYDARPGVQNGPHETQ